MTIIIQQNSGIRLMLMPGARNLNIVTTKFNEPAIEETPSIVVPRIQKSAFMPGVQTTACKPHLASLSGAYMNQPPFGAAPNKKLASIKTPPKRTAQ